MPEVIKKNIVDQLVEHTQLPKGNRVEQKLHQLIKSSGYDKETIQIEEIRKVLMNYLQDTFLEMPELK